MGDDPLGLLTPPKKKPDPSDPLGLLDAAPKAPPVAQSDVTATEPYHARPKEGQMGHQIVDADPDPLPQRIAETVVSGFPGATRAVAGYRGLLSLMGIGHETPEEALQQERTNVRSLPFAARIPLQFTGGAPAAAFLAPLGLYGGGAAFGAAEGADRPASSLKERAEHIGGSAILSALGAKGGEIVGRKLVNLATKSGLTDRVGDAVERVSPSLASRIGTRGQVNAALADRQDILDAIGVSPANPGKRVLDQIAATQSRAGKLYGIARQDKRAIQDPELTALLNDPQVKRAYEVAAQIREVSGNPLPRVEAPEQVPAALQKLGVTPERYAELQKLNASRRVPVLSGTDILPPELAGPQSKGIDLPDPQVLSSLKRYLGNAAEGNLKSKFPVKQDEALALLPKINAIRAKLHSISPAWKQADAFYADAKGQEEAFADGFDAIRHASTTVGKKLATNSPEAMLAKIETPRYPGEPPAAMKARADAFREGVKSFLAEQVRGTTVDRGLESALGRKALAPTGRAPQVRSLAFSNPEEANALESVLSTKRGALLQSKGAAGGAGGGRFRNAVRALTRPSPEPNLLNSPAGQTMLSDRTRSPYLLDQELRNYRGGQEPARLLRLMAGIGVGGQIAR